MTNAKGDAIRRGTRPNEPAAEAVALARFYGRPQTIVARVHAELRNRVVTRETASIDRVRLLTLKFEGRFKAVIAEHERNVEAIGANDKAKAEEATDAHLGRALPSLERLRDLYPITSRKRARRKAGRAASD